jgi:hypothetical protein
MGKIVPKTSDDGSLQQAFMASVAHLSEEKKLDRWCSNYVVF